MRDCRISKWDFGVIVLDSARYSRAKIEIVPKRKMPVEEGD